VTHRPAQKWRGALRLTGWIVVASAVLELCAREVARRSILPGLPGGAPSPWTLVAIAGIGAGVVYLARRHVSRATAPLFAVLLAAGLAAQLGLGARLQSDGFYYFSYLRSLAFDGDLDFTNDYRLLGLGDKPHLFHPTATGHAQSAAAIGPAILWSPFFAAGHAVAILLNRSDPAVHANGISFPYRQAVCVAGLFYGLLGCWFTYRLIRRFYPSGIAAAASGLIVAGSFMLWYLVKEPSMSHAPSMALVAGFVWAWTATRDRRTPVQWTLLGLLAGFMTLVRWQNALFALLPACDAAAALWTAWRLGDRRLAAGTLKAGALFTAAAAVGFVPQMLAWRSIYGSWLAVSPMGPQIRLTDPQIADILWSSRNGLLSTTPVLYAGAVGLVIFAAARPAVGVPALIALAVMTYFNAAIQDWWGSDAFGGRRFDGTIPLFGLGLACIADRARTLVQRFPAAAVAAAGGALVLWNLTFFSAAQQGRVRIGEPMSFGDAMDAQARAFHGWFGNPFTYPASLLFALRNGVPPASYDLLGVNRFLADPLRPYGRIDVGTDDEWVIREGWHEPEREGAITFRWTTGRASLFVPLDRRADLRVQTRLHAFGHPGAVPQSMTLTVNGRAHGPIDVPVSWQTVETIVPADAWRAGVNRVSLQFAWERRPMDVGLGGDPRPLAAAVDYVRVAVVQ
jgi:hypothetical protein